MGASVILETKRLYLREMKTDDFDDLCKILQDAEVMYAYEHAFEQKEVEEWLSRQFERYQTYGFGLWAVIQKGTGNMIGQCGLTMQNYRGNQVLEIGYLFQKAYWHQGYAIEAAQGCKEYAFNHLDAQAVYSIIRDNNFPSLKVAQKNGMSLCDSFVKHYYNTSMPHLVFRVEKSTHA